MNTTIDFNVLLKKILQKGTLAWEYNPFRNYRLDLDMIYYKDLLYTFEEFLENFKYYCSSGEDTDNSASISEKISTILQRLPKDLERPIVYQKGQLVDFITDELKFDLNHPVQILPTYSYDDSVDLIINDGVSKPKIINSRFSSRGKNQYEIVDRTGNNDTNIYDRGLLFEIDTSLYKISTLIPELTFAGISYGGSLKIGNYHFYFKYVDADGNQSDFVCESGLVSVFIGDTPTSITSGLRDENSHKRVRFLIENTDPSYEQMVIYYTRATSDLNENRVVEARKIEQKFSVKDSNVNIIDITGFENSTEVPLEEINSQFLLYDTANTQAVCLNMLFLGNVSKSNEDHNDLIQCAIRIIPKLNTEQQCSSRLLNETYGGDISKTYYDPFFIYNYTGYWDDELYRFGIVFIKNDNTLTSVYNTRGLYLGTRFGDDIENKCMYKDELITYDENTYAIDSKYLVSPKEKAHLENSKGVCYIPKLTLNVSSVIGISFSIHPTVIERLKELNVKGFFIVRQKRIPTTICLAYTIGVELESHIPVLPFLSKEGKRYLCESFLNSRNDPYTYFDEGKKKTGNGNLLSHEFEQHSRELEDVYVHLYAAICPDYDINSPYLNSLFTGTNLSITENYTESFAVKSNSDERLFTVNWINPTDSDTYVDTKVLGVEDNVKLVAIDNDMFSARAGEAEEVSKFEFLKQKNKANNGGVDIVRGSFGPYLGLKGYDKSGSLITIKIPNYRQSELSEYVKIRCFDTAPFYPISDRFDFSRYKTSSTGGMIELGTFYRGDCYICKCTHRMNRNFVDPSTPLNDDIVDPNCWTHNFKYTDGVLDTENLDKVNLGDVNAVNLGMWVTFVIRSNINHSVRAVDDSNVDEAALFGHGRGFYPKYPTSPKSAYKIAESASYNKGFDASVGERYNMELPVVPYYRDFYGTRIAYSDIRTNTFFENAYRLFLGLHYRDYPMTYGSITKLIEFNGSLLCILEHGIYKIAVNERAVAAEGAGGFAYINTSNVLPENPEVVSDTFGSLWIDSVIKTPNGVYGVDTIGRKIWRVRNNGQFEIISDFKILEFLNKNITLTERELTPIIGIRNVKTHYNAFKQDVMFTFYDDTLGLKETSWNICFNEVLGKWITFYSWIPSFSENIYNLYFSFDRNTSKYIAKLGLSAYNKSEGIYLDNTIMNNTANKRIGQIFHKFPSFVGDNTTQEYKYELVRDVYRNDAYFQIDKDGYLYFTKPYAQYTKKLSSIDEIIYKSVKYKFDNSEDKWKYEISKDEFVYADSTTLAILKKERKKRWKESFKNPEKILGKPILLKVYFLNVRITPTVTYQGENATYEEYIGSHNVNTQTLGGYYEYTVAVIPYDHLDLFSTDFWKHGLSGIIDITEKIKPTYWYNELHPFEFEFVVADNPNSHKIFDNLEIISNKAEPESFHYEIVGQCYDFADDKENMYIRQEATKELYLYNGSNISYNDDYKTLTSYHRPFKYGNNYDKSTIFPLYYRREKALDSMIDSYYLWGYKPEGYEKWENNFSSLAGAEVVRYENLNEYRIWNHAKAVDITKEGLLRGNMYYKEDLWYVLINPLNIVQRNETDFEWEDKYRAGGDPTYIVPAECNLFNPPAEELEPIIHLPPDWTRNVISWNELGCKYSQAKLKDKFIKIRIRYSGEDLAIISAINTLYSISMA